MNHRAVVLKIEDYDLTRAFPFEKSYFFHQSAKPHIGRIFRFGLLTTLNKPIHKMLKQLTKEYSSSKSIHTGEAYPLLRYNVEMSQELLSLAPFTRIIENPDNYFMVVPILMKNVLKEAKRTFDYIFPKGFIAKSRLKSMSANLGIVGWRNSYATLLKSVKVIFDSTVIDSPCIFCHRGLLGMSGSCEFGSRFCRENLSFTGHGQFSENLKAYVQSSKAFPEKLEETDHGSIPNNGN